MTVKHEQLIERYPVGNSTILEIVGNQERGYALVLGKDRITDWRKTPQEVHDQDLNLNLLDTIVILIGTMIAKNEELQNEKFLTDLNNNNQNHKQ